MKRNKEDTNIYPKLPVGTPVLILRPHLWSGAVGVVKSVTPNGIHRIHVPPKPDTVCPTDTGYHTDVPGTMLEEYL